MGCTSQIQDNMGKSGCPQSMPLPLRSSLPFEGDEDDMPPTPQNALTILYSAQSRLPSALWCFGLTARILSRQTLVMSTGPFTHLSTEQQTAHRRYTNNLSLLNELFPTFHTANATAGVNSRSGFVGTPTAVNAAPVNAESAHVPEQKAASNKETE